MIKRKTTTKVTKILAVLFMVITPIALQPPQEPLIVMKRGTDIPLLQSEVVRITQSADVVFSPRYKCEPPHFLADFGSFSRFRLQEKHNASYYQYVVQKWHVTIMCCKDTQKTPIIVIF